MPQNEIIEGPFYNHCEGCGVVMLVFGPKCYECGFCDMSYFTKPCIEPEFTVVTS